jgi:hypothetical protein
MPAQPHARKQRTPPHCRLGPDLLAGVGTPGATGAPAPYSYTPAAAAALDAKMKQWFFGGVAVDAEIKERFAGDLAAAAAGECDVWVGAEGAHPLDALAGIILCDQFSR